MQRYNKNYIINNNKSDSYIFRKQDITSYNNRQTNLSEIRERYFASIKILASKFIRTAKRDKIIITGFYYIPGNISIGINENQINNLGLILTKLYNRPVELHLNKLTYPYLDRHILSQYVRLLTQKYNFKRIKKRLFRNIPLTNHEIRYNNDKMISYITGIKIEISGRLITERARPRQTISTAKMGSFIKRNKKTSLDYRLHTFKNSNGALTVKIWLNQEIVA